MTPAGDATMPVGGGPEARRAIGGPSEGDGARQATPSPQNCDNCKTDLTAALMGHQIPDVYDGILFWSCQRCGYSWERAGHLGNRARIARQYVDERNDVLRIQENFCLHNCPRLP